MGRGRRTGILALVVGALSSMLACASFTTGTAGAPDAGATIDAAAPRPCAPDTPFVTTSVVPGLAFPAGSNARLSGDELEIVYEANDSSTKPQVWHASRASRTDGFGPGALVASVDDPGGGWDPSLSGDALTLVFSSGRSNKPGGRNIFIARRPTRTADFGPPVSVGPINDDPNDEAGPYLDKTNEHLWFFRIAANTGSIWIAPRSNDVFGPPTAVFELNASSVGFPVPSDDGAYIYFRSYQGDDAGVEHIWIAQRISPGGRFAGARPVTELNSSAGDDPTWLSPDGCRLYFSSNRSGTDQVYVAERSP